MQETRICEKEESMEHLTQPPAQAVKVSLETSTGVVTTHKESTFESERDLQMPNALVEQAKSITSEHLRIPLTEGVQESQSTGDLAEFNMSTKEATSSIDVLNETRTTEALVYDNITSAKVIEEPECLGSQTMIPHEHTMVSECITISEVEQFSDASEKQRTAHPIQDTFNQLAIAEDQNILEAESVFGTKRLQEFSAKINEVIPTLYSKDIKEVDVYESVHETQEIENIDTVKVAISHAMTHAQTTDLQQTVEGADDFTSQVTSSAVASSTENETSLKLPVNTAVQFVEDVKEFISPTANQTLAKESLEGQNYEVTVTDSQCVENIEFITTPEQVSARATESLNTMFQSTPESLQADTYQKESVIQAPASQEVVAKPILSDILQHTTTTAVTPFELSDQIKHIESTTQEALVQSFLTSEANKLNVQLDELILQKEETFEDTYPIGYGKPFIEGTHRETLISEILPIENVVHLGEDNQALPIEAQVTTAQSQIHKTVSEVETYEETDDFKTELPSEKHFAKVKGDADTKRAKLTTTQTSYIKEDEFAPLSFIEENAKVSKTEKEPLVTEEVISMSSIHESFDLQVPKEVNAKIICESPNEAVTIIDQLAYEQSPILEPAKSNLSTPNVNLVESSTKPVETSTVSIYENVEGHGDFKPQTAMPSPDVLSNLKVSVVEEVSVVPSLGCISKSQPKEAKAKTESITHKNLLVIDQQICENVRILPPDITEASESASYAPIDAKIAALSSELHEKGNLLEETSSPLGLEYATPLIMPFNSCLHRETTTEEQVTILHRNGKTQSTNANVSFVSNTKIKLKFSVYLRV